MISGVSGSFYEYAPRLMAFEFNNFKSKNVIIFIGGLGDGFLTVPYLPKLADELNSIGWSLIQIGLTSSNIGWGTGSLTRDSSEINQLIDFLKKDDGDSKLNGLTRENIVLMGHSTGCQNSLHFISKSGFGEKISGLILQASVCDREAMTLQFGSFEKIDETVNFAKSLIAKGEANEIMPRKYCELFFGVPINASRWASLSSERGDDDFFGSYLTLEDHKKTFGKVDKPLLVLFSGSDEYVPEFINKEKLVDGFKEATDPKYWSPYSKIVDGALHNIGPGSKETSVPIMLESVSSFIKSL